MVWECPPSFSRRRRNFLRLGEGGGLRRCGDGWRAVPVSQILEHVVEVVALSDPQVVERIQEHQQSGRYSCWQQRRAFFAVPQFLFLDRVMDIPVDKTGTHSANCSENHGGFTGADAVGG